MCISLLILIEREAHLRSDLKYSHSIVKYVIYKLTLIIISIEHDK